MKEDDKKLGQTNIIAELLSYFEEKENIKAAYFGMLTKKEAKKGELVLAVTHKGDLEEIKKVVFNIKQAYFPKMEISFVSNEEEQDIFDFVRNTNFAFYSNTEKLVLNQKIMHSWFSKNEDSKTELWEELNNSTPIILVKNINIENSSFEIQTYLNGENVFVPVFSDSSMLGKCGMQNIPEGLTAMPCNWEDVFGKQLNNQYIIINPGTHFQASFK